MMKCQPLISVVLPNYNGEKYLRHALESVCSQTYTNWELFVVDDGSTDASREIVQSVHDPRVRLHSLAKNGHICYALNEGLKLTKGEYVARLDSDDFWYPQKLEKQVAFMEQHPEMGACFSWVDVVDGVGRVLSAKESGFVELFHVENRSQDEWIRTFFFHGSCLCHPSVVMRREALDKVGPYNLALVQIQDFDLWIRIAKQYPIYVMQENLMAYRYDGEANNVSAHSEKTDNRSQYEFYHVLTRYLDDLTDAEFIRIFGTCFLHPNATDAYSLKVERMWLLLQQNFCGYASRLRGMDDLVDLLNDPEGYRVLNEQYGINQKSFYDLSAIGILRRKFDDAPRESLQDILGQATRDMLIRELAARVKRKLARLTPKKLQKTPEL